QSMQNNGSDVAELEELVDFLVEDEDHFKDQPVRTTSSYAQATPFVKAEIKTQFNAPERETEIEQHPDERKILAKDKE
ncbi:hypothetical protein, partial [Acinetobacter variabilis]|uniref:hypothetical protein n=1 Tax=Acinetobacter variabilis TaxID=70346 RepID=UPI0030F84EBE